MEPTPTDSSSPSPSNPPPPPTTLPANTNNPSTAPTASTTTTTSTTAIAASATAEQTLSSPVITTTTTPSTSFLTITTQSKPQQAPSNSVTISLLGVGALPQPPKPAQPPPQPPLPPKDNKDAPLPPPPPPPVNSSVTSKPNQEGVDDLQPPTKASLEQVAPPHTAMKRPASSDSNPPPPDQISSTCISAPDSEGETDPKKKKMRKEGTGGNGSRSESPASSNSSTSSGRSSSKFPKHPNSKPASTTISSDKDKGDKTTIKEKEQVLSPSSAPTITTTSLSDKPGSAAITPITNTAPKDSILEDNNKASTTSKGTSGTSSSNNGSEIETSSVTSSAPSDVTVGPKVPPLKIVLQGYSAVTGNTPQALTNKDQDESEQQQPTTTTTATTIAPTPATTAGSYVVSSTTTDTVTQGKEDKMTISSPMEEKEQKPGRVSPTSGPVSALPSPSSGGDMTVVTSQTNKEPAEGATTEGAKSLGLSSASITLNGSTSASHSGNEKQEKDAKGKESSSQVVVAPSSVPSTEIIITKGIKAQADDGLPQPPHSYRKEKSGPGSTDLDSRVEQGPKEKPTRITRSSHRILEKHGGGGGSSSGGLPNSPSSISPKTSACPSPSTSQHGDDKHEVEKMDTSEPPSTQAAVVDLHPRKRKLKNAKEATSSTPPSSSASAPTASTGGPSNSTMALAPSSTSSSSMDKESATSGGGGGDVNALGQSQQQNDPPPMMNCFEMWFNIRKQIARRRRNLFPVTPKPPKGFKDYLMNRGTYVLEGNPNAQMAIPLLNAPSSLQSGMKDSFLDQEKGRHKLRLQHLVEKEKLVLAVEQEILRVHGRAARALSNQTLPFSLCTILKDEEVYNLLTPEQEEKDITARSRYNGRLFLSWLQDVDDKWDKIKEQMLLRHHNEAESLHAVQKMDWEWKLKELGHCEPKASPSIEEHHVPMVHVSDDFDLLPA